jgi:hypothetical protein
VLRMLSRSKDASTQGKVAEHRHLPSCKAMAKLAIEDVPFLRSIRPGVSTVLVRTKAHALNDIYTNSNF